jgi:hypothetical protein
LRLYGALVLLFTLTSKASTRVTLEETGTIYG